jgi:hypothetical protein
MESSGEDVLKLGFVITSRPTRPDLLDRCFTSLIKTNTVGLERPTLYLIYNGSWSVYVQYVVQLEQNWDVVSILDPPDTYGWDKLAIYGAERMLKDTNITHLGFLPDDFIFNSEWLQQLVKLIERHPGARAWSVYRSAYQRHHRILSGHDYGDVLMTMHDALGTMTREEWNEYGAKDRWDFTCDGSMGGGSTMDIHHAFIQKGERWATGRDYWQNLGVHKGLEGYDCAIDFIGE